MVNSSTSVSPWPVPDVPSATELRGRHVTLERLTADNADEVVAAIGREDTFRLGWGGGMAAATNDPHRFRAFLDGYLPGLNGAGISYLVRRDGECVGTTSVGDFEPARERCHLGWTAYHPQVRGTAVNPETKLLVLGSLFDHGWGRVRIQADVINEPSRRAIQKLGATFEGIVRRDQRRADGSWRDAAVFSIIVDDWPRVRAGLEERLRRFS